MCWPASVCSAVGLGLRLGLCLWHGCGAGAIAVGCLFACGDLINVDRLGLGYR